MKKLLIAFLFFVPAISFAEEAKEPTVTLTVKELQTLLESAKQEGAAMASIQTKIHPLMEKIQTQIKQQEKK